MIDLPKLILYSPDNAFKNINRYNGNITTPASAASGATVYSYGTPVTLSEAPIFTQSYAYFNQYYDANASISNPQWYAYNSFDDIPIYVTTAPYTGWITGTLYFSITGTTITPSFAVTNPYAGTVNFTQITIPYSYIEYQLAN
jgi:hypothetical protein